MDAPADRKYAETHEWYLVENDTVTIGITQYAADELTDITYVELPEVGAVFSAGEPVSEVESVKATSEVLTAVPGSVVEVNAALADHPELINDAAFEEGWLMKLKVDSRDALGSLMTAKEYQAFVKNAG